MQVLLKNFMIPIFGINSQEHQIVTPPPPQYFIICSFLLTVRKPIKQDFKSFEPHFP